MIPELRLVALVPFYNDFKALQRLLMHLSSMKIPSILCDGRFHSFKKMGNSDLSTDGSRFLTSGFKLTTLINNGPCYVDEKINKLFHEAAKQDFTHAVLLGCDEYPQGDVNLLLKNLESLNHSEPTLIKVPFIDKQEKSHQENNFIERIFFMPGLIRARGSHNTFFSAVDQARGISENIKPHITPIEGISIFHDNSIRNRERNELMQDYQEKIKEKKF